MKHYDIILGIISIICMWAMILTGSLIAALILVIVASFRIGVKVGKELNKRENGKD